MPTPDPRVLRSIDAFGQQRQSITDRTVAAIVALFAPFEDWTNPGPITRVTTQAGLYVSSGQRAIAGLTDAYLARTTSALRGSIVSPVGVGPEMSGVLRNGIASWVDVYSRLPAEYRWQRSLGKSKSDALDLTLNRAREMASEDLGLANQRQTAKFTRTRNIAQFRRVIRGEGTCGLCVAAADRIYSRGDLLPIHSRCRCTVMEIGKTDPGQAINDDEITNLYGQSVDTAGTTSGAGLKRVRVEVFEHGELGPQLRVKGQAFRGPTDVRRGTTNKAGSGSDAFWNRPNIEKQIQMTEGLKDSEWRTKQLARLRDWLANN